MKHIPIGLGLCLGLAACGGTPPFGDEATGASGTAREIPEELSRNLRSFSYNPTTQTISVQGVDLEDGPFEEVYRRRPGLDRGDYEAYTAQDGSLDRHSIAYVRDVRGTQAAVAVTGGQFRYFFAGGAYTRRSYSAPVISETNADGGLVTYAGNYVGVLNGPGSDEDLLPVTPGTPGSFLPSQSAEVTGAILINASFSDGTVNGIITDRRFDNSAPLLAVGPDTAADLELAPTQIEEDGTFFGDVTVGLQNRGEYGGIFGGTGATEVAGIVHVEEHIDGLANVEETGVFVLAQCGTADDDPVCDQPVP